MLTFSVAPCFDGFVSDPLWPVRCHEEQAEIRHLTQAMNNEMEAIIRKYPEQYFWMHDRWERYNSKGELSLSSERPISDPMAVPVETAKRSSKAP
jgi:hypothetical protein